MIWRPKSLSLIGCCETLSEWREAFLPPPPGFGMWCDYSFWSWRKILVSIVATSVFVGTFSKKDLPPSQSTLTDLTLLCCKHHKNGLWVTIPDHSCGTPSSEMTSGYATKANPCFCWTTSWIFSTPSTRFISPKTENTTTPAIILKRKRACKILRAKVNWFALKSDLRKKLLKLYDNTDWVSNTTNN